MTDVYVDNKFICETNEPKQLAETIIDRRRKNLVDSQVNVSYLSQLDEIRINMDQGRVRRPLIIVENGLSKLKSDDIEKLKNGEMKWNDLIKFGIVELLDAEEEENAYIAMKPEDITVDHTHLEFGDSVAFGLSASMIPYSKHNRGDRVNLGSKMIKQSIGLYSHNFLQLFGIKIHNLNCPQVPLVQSGNIVDNDSLFLSGQNIIIAIISWEGYNIEDAIVMNSSSVQRGLFKSMLYKTYETDERKYMGGDRDKFCIPEMNVKNYRGEEAYLNLDQDGTIPINSNVDSGNVLVGKISPSKFLENKEEFMIETENARENSLCIKKGESSIVDNLMLSENLDGNKVVKVRVRKERSPEVGDKFSNRHGQKGVISLMLPSEDMPFTSQGIVPDIIFNPHAIPSRLTIGQLLEIFSGKVGALSGKKIDSSSFDAEDVYSKKTLAKFGFKPNGKEVLYDGRTGKKYEAHIYIGPCFYQKLDHMVVDKIQVRSKGPVTLLTKQPTEGKIKDGGLRFGEMEKDNIISHGSVLVLKERFSSDETNVPICVDCGMIAIEDKIKNKLLCQICGKKNVEYIKLPYAFKLFLDELKSMLIYPKLKINKNDNKPNVSEITFEIMSPKTVSRMSSLKVTKSSLYDRDGFPIDGGVMDPYLGSVDPSLRCKTCNSFIGKCPGHFGFLELAMPIIHVEFIKVIYQLLKVICLKCGKIISSIDDSNIHDLKLLVKSANKNCPYCGTEHKKIKLQKPYTFFEDSELMTSLYIRKIFEKISDSDLKILGFNGGRPEWLIITLLPVPPVTVRPSIILESGERAEDDLTHKLTDIIRTNQKLKDNIDIGAPDFIISDLWELLQYHVSTLINNELSNIPAARHRSGRSLKSLTQRLKAKEGRIRGNLLGKRVNFSSRTVISPDPRLKIDEVGIPIEAAKELTIPVVVNKRNLSELKKFISGGDDCPDINYIKKPDGIRKKVMDENRKLLKDELDIGCTIERQIKNGDVVIFGRQPTLHRMSIMCHKVVVLPGKTFRLNPCVCPPYNADFDGDEMCVHVLQTSESRSEAELLMSVKDNIKSPKSGAPIIGGIHDHLSGCYLLTDKNFSLSREDTSHLLGLSNIDIELPLNSKFSGKELFSLFIPDGINMEFKANCCIGCEECKKSKCLYDAYVVIENGELKCGRADKMMIGSENGKLINEVIKKYGNDVTINFLYNTLKFSLTILLNIGASIGLFDTSIPMSAKKKIVSHIEKMKINCVSIIDNKEKNKKDVVEEKVLEKCMSVLNDVSSVIECNIGNSFIMDMIRSGARGSKLNIAQIIGCVGQEVIFGKRIEIGYYDRVLPHFRRNDISPMSRGFVTRGYLQGLSTIEFFFDSMNGREGLMDKGLKTKHSGYMERRLINALQDLKVEYDGTIRNSNDTIIQFSFGEDGIDPSKTEYGKFMVE